MKRPEHWIFCVAIIFPRVLMVDVVVIPRTERLPWAFRDPLTARFPVVLRVLITANPLTVIEDVERVFTFKDDTEAFVMILEDACKRVVDREEMNANPA